MSSNDYRRPSLNLGTIDSNIMLALYERANSALQITLARTSHAWRQVAEYHASRYLFIIDALDEDCLAAVSIMTAGKFQPPTRPSECGKSIRLLFKTRNTHDIIWHIYRNRPRWGEKWFDDAISRVKTPSKDTCRTVSRCSQSDAFKYPSSDYPASVTLDAILEYVREQFSKPHPYVSLRDMYLPLDKESAIFLASRGSQVVMQRCVVPSAEIAEILRGVNRDVYDMNTIEYCSYDVLTLKVRGTRSLKIAEETLAKHYIGTRYMTGHIRSSESPRLRKMLVDQVPPTPTSLPHVPCEAPYEASTSSNDNSDGN